MRQNCLRPMALAGALAGLAVFAVAQETPPPCPAIDPSPLRQGFGGQVGGQVGGQAREQTGLRVFRDPRTGQIRQPSSEEWAAIARAAETRQQEREPVFEVVTHPDGMRSVDLRGAFLMSVVAVRRPDGSVAFLCLPPGARPAKTPALPPQPPALEEK